MSGISVDQLARRQFVLGTNRDALWKGACVVQVSGACFLHHCQSLPVRKIQDAEGDSWFVLGIAISTVANKSQPSVDGLTKAAITQSTCDWSGRWILVGNEQLQPDAASLLGCFYLPRHTGRTGAWASSSLALLALVAADCVGTEYAGEFHHHDSIEWYPLPHARFANVRRLLPTQSLRLDSRTAFFNNYGAGSTSKHERTEDLVAALESRLTTCIKNLANAYSKILLPLTAGMDSRLLLAIAASSGCTVHCFTHEHSNISSADRTVPQRLAHIAGVSHQLVKQRLPDKERERHYDAFTHRMYAGSPRQRFIHNQWKGIGKSDGILLSGNCLEVGRRFYAHVFQQLGMYGDFENNPDTTINKHFLLHSNPELLHAMLEWLSWVRHNPTPGIDWCDRLYIEQRLAGWYAGVEHAFDLLPVEHVPPANCLAIYRIMLLIEPTMRRSGVHQRTIIKRLMPDLLKLPFNPESRVRKYRSRLKAAWAHARMDPFARQIVALFQRDKTVR
jgi:hypothetical protein